MALKDNKETAPAPVSQEPLPPISVWAPVLAIGWIIPGGGHFYLKHHGRGALLLGSITTTFLFGLFMRGAFFQPQTGDLLTTVIYYGGYAADMCSGILYFLATWMGYNQPDVAGHVHDYGTKFLVGAGLLNVLALVDAFEIATKKKP